jgi:hypothetical protein
MHHKRYRELQRGIVQDSKSYKWNRKKWSCNTAP